MSKKTSLTVEESKVLNSILPEKFHKEIWDTTDFIWNLYHEVRDYLHDLEYTTIVNLERELNNKDEAKKLFLESIEAERCAELKIFNVENTDAKLLGMVDIGLVKTFTSASSGNKLEGGAMQLIIEKTFEDSWKTSNAQMKGLNEVKLEFLKKCLKEYPECDSVINYQVDFRELGSSGNVFIYMRGTASILGNEKLKNVINGYDSGIAAWENKFNVEIPNEISNLKAEIQKYRTTLNDVPSNFKKAVKYVERKMNS